MLRQPARSWVLERRRFMHGSVRSGNFSIALCYLCEVLDCFDGVIVGHSMDNNMKRRSARDTWNKQQIAV